MLLYLQACHVHRARSADTWSLTLSRHYPREYCPEAGTTQLLQFAAETEDEPPVPHSPVCLWAAANAGVYTPTNNQGNDPGEHTILSLFLQSEDHLHRLEATYRAELQTGRHSAFRYRHQTREVDSDCRQFGPCFGTRRQTRWL